MIVSIDGHKELCRDTNTMAVINKDRTAYERYKCLKRIKKADKDDVKQMKNDIETLKNVLFQILQKLDE